MFNVKKLFQFLFRAKVLVPLLLVAGVTVGVVAMKRQAETVNSERYRTTAVDRGNIQQRITARTSSCLSAMRISAASKRPDL